MRDPTNASVLYEERITGVPQGFGYVIHDTPNAKGVVKFDGYKDGVLLDTKGYEYAKFVQDGKFVTWFKGRKGPVDQANRQINAVKAAGMNTPIRWEIAEPEAYVAMKDLFAEHRITGITLVHTP